MTAQVTVPPRFSVIVASRGRPRWLKRCLLSLKQQDYPEYEIVVVAESETLREIAESGIKQVPFEAANLASARNRGIEQASGEICAFIDDDAVAEPLWLYRLSEAFAKTSSEAVVGFVRGRNGISFQSRLALIDAEAETHEVPCEGGQPFVPSAPEGQAVKLVGTNMAIRRNALQAIGGFDEVFRFFLEDADMSLRLMLNRRKLAVAPLAEVHHSFAASGRRTRRRTPLGLFDIGRSTSYYLCKHLGGADDDFRDRLVQREIKRLSRHLVAGNCEPGDMRRILASLRLGWEEGLQVSRLKHQCLSEARETPFLAAGESRQSHEVLSSYWLHKRRSLCQTAKKKAKMGRGVTILSFSLTTVRHHVTYDDAGFWLQTGGLFGPSDRDEPALRWCRFAERVERETRRVAKSRGIGEVTPCKWWEHMRS